MSLGKWNSVFKIFSRGCSYDIWDDLHRSCIRLPDLQSVFIDSTIVQSFAPMLVRHRGGGKHFCIRITWAFKKGGYSTKIHAVTDGFGYPIYFTLTDNHAMFDFF